MSTEEVDVVIVGGGPGGVITAIGVARAGYSCIILDKKPRDKIGDKNCGDALDGTHTKILLDEMNIPYPTLESGEARSLIETITIAAKSLDYKLSAHTPAFQVDRLVYGQRLLKTAEDEGVSIRANCAVRGVIIEEDYVRGVHYFDKNRTKNTIRARITIDASGFIGVIRKEIPATMTYGVDLKFPKEYTIGTYREIIKLKSGQHDFPNEIVLLYPEEIPPPGYAWIFTEGPEMLNIGITWLKSIEYPDEMSMKKIYHQVLDQYIDPSNYDVEYAGGGNIPAMPNFDTLAVNGCLIVGDAGGLADPTTFEGHGPALESGRLASLAAIEALEKGDYSVNTLWKYNKLVMNYPGGIHAQSFLVSQFIAKMGIEDFSFLLGRELLSEQDLKDIFQEKKEVGLLLKMKIFLKSFPKWGLMMKLRGILSKIEKTGKIYEEYPESPQDLATWRDKRNKIMGYNF